MNNLAIIPARGGSKRIPRKNIKDFLGKPIIAYSIEAALQSGLFDEVMVSTDDEEIAKVALRYGAKVPFLRSAESANDFATLADVVDDVKNSYLMINRSFDAICLILPTAPLMTSENLLKGYNLLINHNYSSVRPVVRFSYPIQRAFKMSQHKVEMFYPEYQYARSQDLETAYHDAGQFYWMNYMSGLRAVNKFAFEIEAIGVQDIDTIDDWRIAELKYKLIKY